MRFGGIVLLALLGLGACSDPAPRAPESSSSPTLTKPTVPAPTMPAQAKLNTREGAAAFVKHYIDVFNYASNTGDTTELRRLSSPMCEGCQSYITLYERTYKAGGYFKDSDWKLGVLKLDFGKLEPIVYGSVSSPPGVILDSAHSKPHAGHPESSDLTFILRKQSRSWILDTFELQAAP